MKNRYKGGIVVLLACWWTLPVVYGAGLPDPNEGNMQALEYAIIQVQATCPDMFAEMQEQGTACMDTQSACDARSCEQPRSFREFNPTISECVAQCITRSIWNCKSVMDTYITACGLEPVTFTCNEHQELVDGYCVCSEGYISDGNGCIPESPEPACGDHATTTDGTCVCDTGFSMRDGACVSICGIGSGSGAGATDCISPTRAIDSFMNSDFPMASRIIAAVLIGTVGIVIGARYVHDRRRARKKV